MPENNKLDVIIIGGGGAGCAASLEIAKNPHVNNIHLIEQCPDLLLMNSNNTPLRFGVGFHYPDLPTAVRYLHASVSVCREYPGFTLNDSNENLSNWYYFVTTDSEFKIEYVRELYKSLQEEYSNLVKEDINNKVFGAPEDFFEEMSLDVFRKKINISEEQLNKVVNKNKVVSVIRTAERILDWPKFRPNFIEKVNTNKKITVKTQTEVIGVRKEKGKYIVTCMGKDGDFELKVDIVVNSAWSNIEKINTLADNYQIPNAYTKRTKVMIEVELPPELVNVPSMFFCFGPFCSFTNLGNGKGFLTYEPVTNIEATTKTELSETSQRYISGGATKAEIEGFAQKIIKGAADFIPAMANAIFKGTAKFGIVITKARTSIHNRDYSGVETQRFGWIDDACMKLLYLLENAKEVDEIIDVFSKLIAQKIDEKNNLNIYDEQRLKYVVQQMYTSRCAFHRKKAQGEPNFDNNNNNNNTNKEVLVVSQEESVLTAMIKEVEKKLDLNKEFLTKFGT